MATLASDLIQETNRYLFAGQREPLNLLAGAHDASTTTFTFSNDLKAIAEGAYISVDLEILFVWSVSTSAKTATVQRGMLGSTAATHADQALVTVNPKFPAFAVLSAINAELDGLGVDGIFAVSTIEFTYNPAVMTYDLTGVTDVIDILKVESEVPGPSKLWPQLRSYKLHRNAATDDFASGFGITLYSGVYPGREVRVTYSKHLSHLTALTSDVQTVAGLPATANDIPPLGAAMRLAGVRELARNFFEVQSDTRRAQEVGTNAQGAAMQSYARLYAKRVRTEVNNLASSYPARLRQLV